VYTVKYVMAVNKPYRRLLAIPFFRRWTLVFGLIRIPFAMTLLALVIAGHYATGSFRDGALLAGADAFAGALAAPWCGRALDRRERRSGIVLALAGSAASLGVLLAAVLAHAPLVVLLPAAIALGAFPSGIAGALRSYLPTMLPRELQPSAYSFDAAVLEVEWLCAPALVAVIALLGSPPLVLVVMFAFVLLAAAATLTLPRLDAAPRPATAPTSAWRSRAGLPSYVASGGLGLAEGMINVALPALLVLMHTRAAAAGFLLAALSATSAIGGFTYGSIENRVSLSHERQAGIFLAALGLLVVPVALASSLWIAALAVSVFGLFVAPMNSVRTQILARVIPPAQQSEAFSTASAAMAAGWGLSGLLAGALSSSAGPRGALLVAAATALVIAATTTREPVRLEARQPVEQVE
jgi:MFS family permease